MRDWLADKRYLALLVLIAVFILVVGSWLRPPRRTAELVVSEAERLRLQILAQQKNLQDFTSYFERLAGGVGIHFVRVRDLNATGVIWESRRILVPGLARNHPSDFSFPSEKTEFRGKASLVVPKAPISTFAAAPIKPLASTANRTISMLSRLIPFSLLFPVSILAGFVGAMSGMGGGIVLIPTLTLLGIDIKHAIAVSILSVIATSSGSASAYVRDHITNLKVGMFLEMFTIVGALVGASITLASSPRPLYIVFGCVLLGSWVALFLAGHMSWHGPAAQDAVSRWLELEGSYYDQALGKTIRYAARRAHLGTLLMFGAGIIAGLLGIGAGAVKVLIHDLVMGLPPKVSTTTSNLIIGVTALAGTSVYLAAGLINPGLAAPVILGVVFGAFLGTRLLVRLSNQSVRRFFLVVLLVLAFEMIIRGLRGV